MSPRRTYRPDYSDPWWRKDYGGMPGWLIVIVVAAILAIGVFAAARILG